MTESEFTSQIESANEYRPTARYWLYATAGALIALLYGWELAGVLRGSFPLSALLERLLFLCVGLGLLGWGLYTVRGRVVLAKDRLIWHKPVGAPEVVQFRQLISATEAGRFGTSLALLYHPLRPDGLVDLDDARSLFLPTVGEQDALLARLQEKIPT
ncbi:MAG: hypothetical protein KDE47_29615 [Caldilineaceae bacterium]|nr:hypothetical protein [Caldilineaceae bacterium]MCB9151175.1 hypothetical protein [Caldilineaceae bacterium]MCB9156187.1 hypothetical protein [Caldilineaceae bacterium]